MIKKYPREWERVNLCDFWLKVFGGWIFLIENRSSEFAHMCFIPDPVHEWILEDNNR